MQIDFGFKLCKLNQREWLQGYQFLNWPGDFIKIPFDLMRMTFIVSMHISAVVMIEAYRPQGIRLFGKETGRRFPL